MFKTFPYTGYFDAGGKAHEARIFYVSGFLSTVEKWLEFEDEWGRLMLMETHGIVDAEGRPCFHTTDYVAAKKPPYSQFEGKDGLRDEFETVVTRILKTRTGKPVSVGLLLDEFRRIQDEYVLPFPMDPFALCGMYIMKFSLQWMARHKINRNETEFVFEDGDGKTDFFRMFCKNEHEIVPQFRAADRHTHFQAADVLAWRHARLIRDHDSGRPIRRVLWRAPHPTPT